MTKTTTSQRSAEVLDKLELDIPRSWNDFSREQLMKACDLFIKPKEKTNFLTRAAMDLLGLKLISFRRTPIDNIYLFKYQDRRIAIDSDQLAFICRHFEFLLKESNLVENRIYSIRRGFRRYYGPEKKLYNMSYDEFRSAENFFLAYNKTKDPSFLDKLVATMYRPKRKGLKRNSLLYDGDIREPFNPYIVEKRAGKFRTLPMKYKIAAFQYFFGCMKHLTTTFHMVFEPGSGGQIYDRVQQSLRMLDYLAGGDVTKTKAVLQANVYEIMTRMQAEREKIKQMETINRK